MTRPISKQGWEKAKVIISVSQFDSSPELDLKVQGLEGRGHGKFKAIG